MLSDVRTLTVLPGPPSAQGGATERCAIALLLGLREHGVDARAIAPDLAGRWSDDAEQLHVHRVPVVAPAGIRARLAHIRRPMADLSRTALLDAVREAARDVDLVHLEGSLTAWLDDGAQVPSVLSMHYRARLDQSPIPLWRGDGRDLLLFSMLERRMVRDHRWLIASSEAVAASMRSERPHADVTVAPLSLDPAAYSPASHDGAPTAGMIGTASWPPTRDALGRLLSGVWPAVRARARRAELVVAGRGMAAAVSSDATSGVTVLGEVASTQAFLTGLSVLVYPVTRGSGMKVKVLEAIASGVPVVTTRAGSEGFAPSDGIIVHDDDVGLVDATWRLLEDVDERKERGRAARRLFEEQYSPVPATVPVVDLYRRVLG